MPRQGGEGRSGLETQQSQSKADVLSRLHVSIQKTCARSEKSRANVRGEICYKLTVRTSEQRSVSRREKMSTWFAWRVRISQTLGFARDGAWGEGTIRQKETYDSMGSERGPASATIRRSFSFCARRRD